MLSCFRPTEQTAFDVGRDQKTRSFVPTLLLLLLAVA